MTKTRASLGVIAATLVTVMTLFLLPFTPRVPVRTVAVERGSLTRATLLEGVVGYQDQQPCLSLQAGVVSGVHVREGQTVKAGQLLFSLDSSAEEQALAELAALRYEGERLAEGGGEAVTLAFAAQSLSWKQQEAALRGQVEAKRIRAAKDGVMGAVYAAPGELVAAGTALGLTWGAEKCVTAACRTSAGEGPAMGAAAALLLGEESVPGVLVKAGAPALDPQTGLYLRPMTFSPREPGLLAGWEVGKRVTVRVLGEALEGVALVPLEAVGEGGLLWLAQDGAATAVKAGTGQRNGEYLCVPEKLLGQRVILLPDGAGLSEGCAIKEARAR